MITLFYIKEEHPLHVKTSQLIPQCILTEDVTGKTGHPIVKADTVLTETHIEFLKRFLVDSVYVSKRLNNGRYLNVKEIVNDSPSQKKSESQVKVEEKSSFRSHYQYVISSYERIYSQWRNKMPIDMPTLRKHLIPLIERIEDEDFNVADLHACVTKYNYHYAHDVAISLLSAFLGEKMGYKKGEWLQIGLAGCLSNIGMSQISPKILNKESGLSDEEREEVKKHTVYSYRLVEPISILTQGVKLAVLQHHERLDGSGYPLGLQENKIHSFARIIAVSDTFLAMTSERYHQAKQSPQIVLEQLQTEHDLTLDQAIVQVLVDHY